MAAGDEVIAFDPAYDSYEPAVRLAGGRCVRVPLRHRDFRYDWDAGAGELMHRRTRLVLFNSPAQSRLHRGGAAADLDALAAVVREPRHPGAVR